MKKVLTKITLLTLILVMVLSLAACTNNTPGSTDSGREDVGSETFTVTFDSQGGTRVEPAEVKVQNGALVTRPEIDPSKMGYKFLYWTSDDKNSFNFNETPITHNITLKAVWESVKMNHELDKTLSLPSDSKYQIITSMDTPTEQGGDWNYYSQYGTKNSHPILLLTEKGSKKSDKKFSNDDYFVYFYTLERGKEVQFTTWAKKPTDKFNFGDTKYTHVTELSDYKTNGGSRIYAKWHSQLPKVVVKVSDLSETNPLDENLYASATAGLKFHDSLEVLKEMIPANSQSILDKPTKDGYEFIGWKYVMNAGDKDKEVTGDLYFNDTTELTEAYLEKVNVPENEDYYYSLTIRPIWRKVANIKTAADYVAFYDSVKAAKAQLKTNPKDKKAIKTYNDLCDAKIIFHNDINFNDVVDRKLEPLFNDYRYPFTGEMSTFGGKRVTISNLKLANMDIALKDLKLNNVNDNISLLGYVSHASIKGLTFTDVTFEYLNEYNTSNTTLINVATLANHVNNNTKIERCDFIKSAGAASFDFVVGSEKANSRVLYGVIASHFENSLMSDCDVTFNETLRVAAIKGITLGFLVGESNYKADEVNLNGNEYGDIRNCNVKGNLNLHTDSNKDINSKIEVGGLVGNLSKNVLISTCKYEGTMQLDSFSVIAGGLVGNLNNAKILNSYATNLAISLGAASKENNIKAKTMAHVGGLIGHGVAKASLNNVLQTSYVNFSGGIKIYAEDGCKVYAAGLIGYAQNTAITNCFAMVAPITINYNNTTDTLNDLTKDYIHIGYLFAPAKDILSNIAEARKSYYLLNDNADKSGTVESIKVILGTKEYTHTITMEKPQENQNPVPTSNFNISLEKAGTSLAFAIFSDAEKIIDTTFYKDILSTNSNVHFKDEFWVIKAGSAPTLRMEDNKVKFNVTFDAKNGTDLIKTTVFEGETIKVPEVPTKEGYTFKHWALNNKDVPFDFNTPVYMDYTLTAIWEKVTP